MSLRGVTSFMRSARDEEEIKQKARERLKVVCQNIEEAEDPDEVQTLEETATSLREVIGDSKPEDL